MIRTIRSNLDFLKTITEEQWKNILETDYSGVLQGLSNEEFVEVFSSMPRQIRSCVLDPYTTENLNELPDPVPDELIEDLKCIKLLKDLISRLNRDVTIEFIKGNLEENNFFDVIKNVGKIKKLPIGLLLYRNLSIEFLQQCLLLSRYERYAYTEYNTLLNLEGVNDPLREAELRQLEQRGIQNPQITEDLVNQILHSYETANRTGMSSTCPKVLYYNNEIVVFILRESQRGGLRTFQEYIVGMNADWIVLRFSTNLRNLKVRALDVVKEEVYLAISDSIFQKLEPALPVNYVKSSLGNSNSIMQVFYRHILTDQIPGISLYMIDLNAPFAGIPSIIIQRNSSNLSLVASLNDNARGFSLSSIIPHSTINRIKVKYTFDREDHIFTLKIVPSNNQSYVLISGQGGGIKKRQNLIRLLRDFTGVKVLESKESR